MVLSCYLYSCSTGRRRGRRGRRRSRRRPSVRVRLGRRFYGVIPRGRKNYIRYKRKLIRVKITYGRVGIYYRRRWTWRSKSRIVQIYVNRKWRYTVKRGRRFLVRYRKRLRPVRCGRGKVRIRVRKRWRRIKRRRRRLRKRRRKLLIC